MRRKPAQSRPGHPGRLAAAAGGVAVAALLLGAGLARAGELGAFFAPGAVADYELGPGRGTKGTLRPRTAYAVVGVAWDGSERLWLKVRVPEAQRTVRGAGWTALTAQELGARKGDTLKVHLRPVEPGQPPAGFVRIPAADVQVSGESQPSRAYPQVAWRPVRYASRLAAEAWVPAARGIYRPGRSPAFLTGVAEELRQHNVPAEEQRRLLAGIVRAGDSAQQARWAWGEPLRTWQEGTAGKRVVVWSHAEGQLRFDGDTVKDVR
jgi:hypothetical protein